MQKYTYPSGTALIRAVGVLVFIVGGLTFVAGSLLALTNGTIEGIIIGIFIFVFGTGALFGGIAHYIAFPQITITEEKFRISAGPYHSPWFAFGDIDYIEVITLPFLEYRVLAVSVPALPKLFFWASFTGSLDRGFLVPDQINGYDEIVSKFKTSRPDLVKAAW
jgi:hypothetical protein